MKNYLFCSLFIFFLLAFLPLASLTLTKNTPEEDVFVYDVSDVEAEAIEESTETLRVLQVSSNNVLNMDMTEYLIGAVASEMPASFSEEALKAQAVACYTYVKWILQNADNAPNEFSDISDDSNIHQGFLTREQMKERWGSKFDTYYSKLKRIVESVKGEYISYQDEPILAVFHGISAGKTNNAASLWNNDIPYLVSVDAPGDKLSAELVSENVLTHEEFLNITREKYGASKENNTQLIEIIDTDEQGYVSQVKIGEAVLSRTDVRSVFGLKSPNFKIEISETSVIFTVYGKGHGLGMSQYSADFMARQGSDYKEILLHFYQGTQLVSE